jgi:probable rRNA maturation factor
MPQSISFHFIDTPFRLRQRDEVRKWLSKLAKSHQHKVAGLQYIFCTDAFLLQINKQFLNHDTYTDIITFDYSTDYGHHVVAGEIYISIDRIRENAKMFLVRPNDELHRVMAHGLLHICGFRDKTTKEQTLMRKQEENALALRQRKLTA